MAIFPKNNIPVSLMQKHAVLYLIPLLAKEILQSNDNFLFSMNFSFL
jgi:hypothetical protein